MSNEVFFVLTAFLDLSLVLLAWKLGKSWLIATILGNIALVFTFSGKLIPLFGLVSTTGEIFYVSIFIATDMLSEHHGQKIAYRSIGMGFLIIAMVTIMGQLVLQFSPIEESVPMAEAMQTVFGIVPRIAVAGVLAYVTAQSFDIWFFHVIRKRTGFHKLWLRNNLSTFTSLAVDTCIFFPLAFAGTVPIEVLGSLLLSGWLLKVPIALLDTPFLYLSYVVKGQQPPDFGRRKREHESAATGMP